MREFIKDWVVLSLFVMSAILAVAASGALVVSFIAWDITYLTEEFITPLKESILWRMLFTFSAIMAFFIALPE